MIANCILASAAVLLAGASFAQSPLDDLTEADIADGQRLYRLHCARCHGVDGAGGEGSNLVRARFRRAPDDQALVDLIGEGIPGTAMPRMWTLDEPQRERVAGYVRTLGTLAAEALPGDPARGAEIYRTRGGCPACHILDGQGTGIGPELTGIGERRGREYLARSMIDPSESQPATGGYRDFLTVRVQTGDAAIEGMRVNEDAFSVQVRDMSGRLHSFRKDELVNYQKVFAHSLMPDYANVLSGEDVDDVVSFLMSQRSDP